MISNNGVLLFLDSSRDETKLRRAGPVLWDVGGEGVNRIIKR